MPPYDIHPTPVLRFLHPSVSLSVEALSPAGRTSPPPVRSAMQCPDINILPDAKAPDISSLPAESSKQAKKEIGMAQKRKRQTTR